MADTERNGHFLDIPKQGSSFGEHSSLGRDFPTSNRLSSSPPDSFVLGLHRSSYPKDEQNPWNGTPSFASKKPFPAEKSSSKGGEPSSKGPQVPPPVHLPPEVPFYDNYYGEDYDGYEQRDGSFAQIAKAGVLLPNGDEYHEPDLSNEPV